LTMIEQDIVEMKQYGITMGIPIWYRQDYH
jgi:hypothetical protein